VSGFVELFQAVGWPAGFMLVGAGGTVWAIAQLRHTNSNGGSSSSFREVRDLIGELRKAQSENTAIHVEIARSLHDSAHLMEVLLERQAAHAEMSTPAIATVLKLPSMLSSLSADVRDVKQAIEHCLPGNGDSR